MSSITAFADSDGFTQSFSIDDVENIKRFFDQHGFVVVRDVIDSSAQIDETIDEIWNYLRLINGNIDRNDPSTWEDRYWPVYLGLRDGGFISHDTDLVMKMCWQNRQHPNVVRLFQIILQRDDLWVKFDRYGMMRPTQGIPMKQNKDDPNSVTLVDRPEWQSKSNWLHWDQNPWKYPDFMGVQGLLALSDTNPQTGGFHCVPDFVPHFKQWSIDNEAKHRSRGGLINVPPMDPIREQIQQIHLRRGSFLIWDSRTPHGNFPNQSDRFRIVQYITFSPAKEDNEQERVDRLNAFHMRKMSAKFNEAFQGFPEPILTDLGKKILGAKSWKTGEEFSNSFE